MTLDLGTRMKLVSNEGSRATLTRNRDSPFGPASAFTRKEKPDLRRDGGGPPSIRRLGGAACARLREVAGAARGSPRAAVAAIWSDETRWRSRASKRHSPRRSCGRRRQAIARVLPRPTRAARMGRGGQVSDLQRHGGGRLPRATRSPQWWYRPASSRRWHAPLLRRRHRTLRLRG